MDKKRIEEFAVSSRRQLIENLTYEANKIGITKEEIKHPDNVAEDMQTFTSSGVANTIYGKQIEQRQQLINEIEQNGFNQTIEKIAYTWFNRIIAIRFMEINNYLPTKTRVLSSITPGKKEPDIITEALNINLDYTTEEKKQIYQLKEENNTDELFKLLFIKQCNKLNEILPELFETIDDYTELLFNIQLSNENNLINKLITSIPEEDFQNQVEIIGWLYQYYNKELKDEIFFNLNKKNIKISKENIPASTQVFTPDWIVRYMVENSLGKLWIEKTNDKDMKDKWHYYVDDPEQDENTNKLLNVLKENSKNLDIEKITIIDPCMGSGHILVYAFELLMDIYMSQGYTKKNAVLSILENNLYGLDIDERAYQLAYFALIMKARSYDKRIFNRKINLNITSFVETNDFNYILYKNIVDKDTLNYLSYLKELFKDSRNYGSLLRVNEYKNVIKNSTYENTDLYNIINKKFLKKLLLQTKLLSMKYDVVITNPPYMGSKNMNKDLLAFIKKEYPEYKMDYLSAFIKRGFELVKENGFNVLVITQSWMFLSSYEKVRNDILGKFSIYSLLYMGPNVMGIGFGTSAVVFRNIFLLNYNTVFNQIDLIDLNKNNIPNTFPSINNRNMVTSSNKYRLIPNHPIAFWADDNIIKLFDSKLKISDVAPPKKGLVTMDNDRFLRLWHEINFNNFEYNAQNAKQFLESGTKWAPLSKGGGFSKWYGNKQFVINWKDNGKEIKEFIVEKYNGGSYTKEIRNEQLYFKPMLSWSGVSLDINFRLNNKGFLFDSTGPAAFPEKSLYNILGYLNSKVIIEILKFISPTLSFSPGNIGLLPIPSSLLNNTLIEKIVKENILLVKNNYDLYETSWDFKKHHLMIKNGKIEENYKMYLNNIDDSFVKLKNNEMKLNSIIIKECNLNSILDNKISDEYISIKKLELNESIKSLLSYSIGCMFGRYSIDKEGLIYPNKFDLKKYSTFIPVKDNIIPVLNEEYLNDDVVNEFIKFIEIAFGTECLDDNLEYIANILNKKGHSNRDIIRNYFINDFFKDHVKMYSVPRRKAPIYWMFDSGKQNAFKCLIYMHRYEPDLLSRIRFDYLHKTQRAIEENIKRQENIINNSENKSHIKKATKEKIKLVKQLDEIKLYDQALAHVANERIEIDLDDGVKVNYAKFQNIEVVDPKTNKTKKINLLAKL